MFGYLQIDKAELKVREYEAYKAVYCGLCKQLGKDYSFLTRLALSYDCTFYTMMLMSLSSGCSGFSDGRCRFNPLKKCRFADCKNDCYSKAAALSVISVYYKLMDELMDSGAALSGDGYDRRGHARKAGQGGSGTVAIH